MQGSVWTSSKALEGYMAFHHLLLALAEELPAIRAEAERRVKQSAHGFLVLSTLRCSAVSSSFFVAIDKFGNYWVSEIPTPAR